MIFLFLMIENTVLKAFYLVKMNRVENKAIIAETICTFRK